MDWNNILQIIIEKLYLILNLIGKGVFLIRDWVQSFGIIAYLSIGIGLIILIFAWRFLAMFWHLALNHFLGVFAKAYQATSPNGKRVLIVGDSTAVGVGAKNPEDSIAGRLHKDFPNTEIINASVKGSSTRDVTRQLKSLGNQKFDLIIISTGGNDVFELRSINKTEDELIEVLTIAKQMSGNRVILLLYGNVGAAPVFPFFLRNTYLNRALILIDIFRRVSEAYEVPCVELYTRAGLNPFVESPDNYFASDGIHPNSEGYRLWYNKMWQALVSHGIHYID